MNYSTQNCGRHSHICVWLISFIQLEHYHVFSPQITQIYVIMICIIYIFVYRWNNAIIAFKEKYLEFRTFILQHCGEYFLSKVYYVLIKE